MGYAGAYSGGGDFSIGFLFDQALIVWRIGGIEVNDWR
jgi:hypothetical protein